MKFLVFILASLAPISAIADTLPVRISIGDDVFLPQGEITLRQNLRTMSTPPYAVLIPSEDLEAFGRFTAGGVGRLMEVFVCEKVVLSAFVRVEINNPYIAIHNAPKGGLLDQFTKSGCP